MMRPMIVVSGDFVETGGMDAANYHLARYAARCGREVHLVAHRVAPELATHEGVHVHLVPKPASSYLLSSPLLDWAGRRCAAALAGRGARVVVNGGNCSWADVNWVHFVHAAYQARTRTGVLRRLKARVDRFVYRSTERSVIARARLVIANSQATRRDLIERVGIAAERIRVVYLGIDPSRFAPAPEEERPAIRRSLGWPEERPVIAFVGALGDSRKGFDTLFEAWRALCERPDWDAGLVVIGTGAELPLWRARASGAGLDERIRFLGFRRDVPSLLQASDALVSPTRYEPYGVGVQEALCMGIPAFVTNSAGIAERYPPEMEALLLPDPDDPRSVASALLNWRRRRREFRDMAHRLAQVLRGHTWERMSREFVDHMESAA